MRNPLKIIMSPLAYLIIMCHLIIFVIIRIGARRSLLSHHIIITTTYYNLPHHILLDVLYQRIIYVISDFDHSQNKIQSFLIESSESCRLIRDTSIS